MEVKRRKPSYRPGTSQNAGTRATFREQMADFVRGERLRELREGRHLSRERVAADLGITTKTLYTWEHGRSKIKWENAQKAGRYFGVDPEGLVSRGNPDENGQAPALSEVLGGTHSAQLDRVEKKLDEILEILKGDDENDADLPAEPPTPPAPEPSAPDEDAPPTDEEEQTPPAG